MTRNFFKNAKGQKVVNRNIISKFKQKQSIKLPTSNRNPVQEIKITFLKSAIRQLTQFSEKEKKKNGRSFDSSASSAEQ